MTSLAKSVFKSTAFRSYVVPFFILIIWKVPALESASFQNNSSAIKSDDLWTSGEKSLGSGLVSVLSGRMSPVFCLGPLADGYFARILFMGIQLAGLFFVRPVPSNA